MGVLIANEVGIFRCKFDGIKACKNPDYVNVCVTFEVEIGGEVKDCSAMPRSQYLLHDAEEAHKFSSLQKDHIYLMKMSVGYQSPNEKGGKTYPGGVRFRILQVSKEV